MNATTIREIIARVNKTLCYYEKDYISVKRTPEAERERTVSFEQYIEARFNYECCQIPELYDIVIALEGHLWQNVQLVGSDTAKRRFTEAKITLIDPESPIIEDPELKNAIYEIAKQLGGSSVRFNNVKKKIKFVIE